MKRFKEYLNEGNLHVYDIDDTLFHTTAKVKVKQGNKEVASLSNSQYNYHKLPAGHEYDFSEFRSAHKFDTESKPVHRMLGHLKDTHTKVTTKRNGKVILNTARQDFDDRKTFLGTFKKHGVDIDNIHVHRAGNLARDNGLTVAQSKNEIIHRQLKSGQFHTVHLYDDNKTNLTHFLGLKEKHPNVKFKAHHVRADGTMKKHVE